MPELRKDPVTSRWVIIATERGKRPSDFTSMTAAKAKEGFCPFCYGHEGNTPFEIWAYRPDHPEKNTPGWKVRVVPNKFPALRIEGELNRRGMGMYDLMDGIGAHEVIVETPEHDKNLEDLSDSEVGLIIDAYRNRGIDLKKDVRFQYILIFRNYGKSAGASLKHPHSQLIATPIVPKRVQEEINGVNQHFQYKERCVFCDIIHQELSDGSRLVLENRNFLCIEPFAPRFPFETWIIPKKHQADFLNITDEETLDMARILKSALTRLKVALKDPAYNYTIHTMPLRAQGSIFHWHLEIMPKLIQVAGFEWGSGFYINPTPPEDAAKYLREVEI